MQLDEEQRGKDAARDIMLNAERRANTMQNALEEAKTLLDQADRAIKMTEQEAIDLVTKSIRSAINRDSASGDGIDLLIVTKEEIREQSVNT